jgi:bifunctional non-homologous end joining protein LigD
MAPLEEYRRKRKFERTPEPPGKPAPQEDNFFVVQKHAARRLHYDFRLAIQGVLKSWAVPKGPSQNPADKRLAVQTEDHPMAYGNFEGKIPEGNYGAGTVMVWDRGTYRVIGDLDAGKQLQRGEIKFDLHGEKLRGSFVLVKLKQSEKGNEWLMIKHKDEAVDPAWNIEEHDGSALTGRVLEEIAEELPPKRSPAPLRPSDLQSARKSAMPARLEPMLSTPISSPFSDPNWLFEIKWDGVRALTWIADGKLELRSRAGGEITKQYPELAGLPENLSAAEAILDGEIVVLDSRGHSDFEQLQERMHVRVPPPKVLSDTPVTYYIFDLLYCDGYDLREAPLLERKELLRRLLHSGERFRFSDHQVEHGKELFELARVQGLEGIVGKRSDSRYASVRSAQWVKIKATKTLDAVVGGWTEPRGSRSHFGSLLLGLYEGRTMRFIGHAGSGFNEKSQQIVAGKMKEAAVSACPFDKVPETNEKAHWTRPAMIARIQFSGWTEEKRLRHPVFVALREDADPQDCRWESEMTSEAAPATAPAPTIVQAPAIAGRVLVKKAQIEAELFKGKAENISIELDGKRLRLSNLNKIYFPDSGITKRDLLAYYYRIADYILPFLKERPLVLRRYPDGMGGNSFFQKDIREGLPEWFETVAIPSEGKAEEIHYAIANDRASLLFLTGLGCIDHNPWTSRRDDIDHPDYFFFDLDPADGTDFSVVIKVAQALYKKLDEIGLRVFLKTSGATGFHMYLPVENAYTYEQLRTFAEIVARMVASEKPELVTQERTVAKRPAGRVLIDVHQNAHGRPLAAPYSVRAFLKAPVSTPVLPSELRESLRPEKFNLKTLFARLEKKGDLWRDFWKSRQTLEKAIEQLSKGVSASNKSR